MKKVSKKKEVRESQMLVGLREVIRADLRSFVVTAGMCALESLLERSEPACAGLGGATIRIGNTCEEGTRVASWCSVGVGSE